MVKTGPLSADRQDSEKRLCDEFFEKYSIRADHKR
jgi:hypothetical protein